MKRYKLLTETRRTVDYFRMNVDIEERSTMDEDDLGEWVRWAEVSSELAKLEERIPEVRIARLERKLGLIATGKCPCCGENVSGWKAPSGSFAPEGWASLKERGINPMTGHKCGCEFEKQ